jgi:Uma2 family endonuclease
MTATQTTLITVADLEAMGTKVERFELIEGVPYEMSPSGIDHGDYQAILHLELGNFVRKNRLGRTYVSDAGFVMTRNPDTVLVPDVSFVSKERLPNGQRAPIGFASFAPDIAIEVVSPSNTESEILRKTGIYLAGGVRAVWLVRPEQRTVTVFTPDAPERILQMGETLDGGNILPGFALPLVDIFQFD